MSATSGVRMVQLMRIPRRFSVLGVCTNKSCVTSIRTAAASTNYANNYRSQSARHFILNDANNHFPSPILNLRYFSTGATTDSIKQSNNTHNNNNNNNNNNKDDNKDNNNNKNINIVAAYLDLSKARLSALVVATTAAGFVASGVGSLPTMGAACLGTALCSSSAAAFNQIFEIQRDTQMKRTQQRPLVQNHITVTHATLAATTWGIAGTYILYLGTDPYTTLLGATNIALYSGLYTWMKPRSKYNTWLGAVVGAIPPIMGWSAATNGQIFDLESLLLGGTLYFWQMPHFFALSFMHRIDYARGGFKMVSTLEQNGEQTAQLIKRYSWYLSTIPILSTLTGVTSTMFLLEGFLLNGYFLKKAYDFDSDRTNANARQLFLTSLWYLPCLLMLFLLHSKTLYDDNLKGKDDNIIREEINKYLSKIRNAGKELCLHETIIHNNKEEVCPVVLTKHTSEAAANTIIANEAVVVAADNGHGQDGITKTD